MIQRVAQENVSLAVEAIILLEDFFDLSLKVDWLHQIDSDGQSHTDLPPTSSVPYLKNKCAAMEAPNLLFLETRPTLPALHSFEFQVVVSKGVQ